MTNPMRPALASLLLLLAGSVPAQSYPSQPIRVVVPFPPGGTVDVTARAIGPALTEILGQTMVIENRGGAQGLIGTEFVARTAPNGYTLLLGSNSTLSVAPSLQKKSPYDPVRDFAPVSMIGMTPFVLVVHPSVPASAMKEFIAIAKRKPETFTMGSGGVGHLVGELFQTITGTKFVHVPFQGTGPAGAALMGGHVDLLFDQLANAVGQVKGGKFRPIAISSAARSTVLPGIPTMAESGVKGFEVTSITGLLAPAATPKDVIGRLNAAVHKALARPDVRERFASMALETIPGSPEQFTAYIREDLARWTKVVRDAGIPLN
jgi:tripartite-type tricarboxylate transporter receptor subunit TctC